MNYDLCIIGGGISGLATAKFAKKANLNFILLNKDGYLGGNWFNKSYTNLKLQTNRNDYEFPDFPYPKNVGLYPTYRDILSYLTQYAKYFKFWDQINNNCEVFKTKQLNSKAHDQHDDQDDQGDDQYDEDQDNDQNDDHNIEYYGWQVSYVDKTSTVPSYQTITAKYICFATGYYHTRKYPDIPMVSSSQVPIPQGQQNRPLYIHSNDFNKYPLSTFKNKRVIVIGNGSTGSDLACLMTKYNPNVVLLYRTPKWVIKRYLHIWGFLSFSTHHFINRNTLRLAETLNLKFYLMCMYCLLYFFMIINGEKPVPLPKNKLSRTNLFFSDVFNKLITQKKITYIRSTKKTTKLIETQDSNYLLNNNKKYNYDIIIYATGYHNDIPLMNYKNLPDMYKLIIKPDMRNCGFVGYGSSYNWLQISDVQASWFIQWIKNEETNKYQSELEDRTIGNPSRTQMLKQMKVWRESQKQKDYVYNDITYPVFDYLEDLRNNITTNKL
jgi:hypothetical protein